MFEMYFLRPDAMNALEDPLVKKGLPRYVKVVKDELPPKFRICKRVSVSNKEKIEKMNETQLWNLHEKYMKKFKILERKIDRGEKKLEELEIPKFSLLDLKLLLAEKIMEKCEFCERKCGMNRLEGKVGFCKAGMDWKIFGAHAHWGEEAELVPSGTIFQAACTLRCVHCQNAPESISPELGEKWKIEEVVEWIKKAKEKGLRNMNWVGGDPTPWTWHIISALKLCDVNLAQVWNSNSYYSEKTAKLLEGLIDVYLLDFKYFNEKCAERISKCKNYPEICKRNHLIAKKAGELLIRILVLPNHVECDAKPIVRWIKENLGEWVRVNLMDQYRPCFKAYECKEITRRLSMTEYDEVVHYAKKVGLKNLVRD